ncbi:MAG: tripartite tricarboxylate transporter substrate-binding protein, partial [Pseudomonadota bacterium]
GSGPHVRTELFKFEHKLDMVHVPYNGAAPALVGVLGGEINMMFIPLPLVEAHHRAGRVRMIGVSTAQRLRSAPDVLTFAEQGIPLTGASWMGFLGPANIPAEIVTLLNREINAMLDEPQMRETLGKSGLEVSTSTPREFKAYLESEYEFWGTAIRTANIPKE